MTTECLDPNSTNVSSSLRKKKREDTSIMTKVSPQVLQTANENINGKPVEHRFTGTKINVLDCLYQFYNDR